MANKRIISSDIYQDEWFSNLTLLERFIWIGLFTSCADSQGRALDKAVHIRTCIFPYEDMPLESIGQAIIKFAEAQKILRYEIKGTKYIQILRWWTYQCPKFAGESKHPAPASWQDHVNTTVGKISIKKNWFSSAKHKEQEQAFIEALDAVTDTDTESDTDTNIGINIETNTESHKALHIPDSVPDPSHIPIPDSVPDSVPDPSAPNGAQTALSAASTPPTAPNFPFLEPEPIPILATYPSPEMTTDPPPKRSSYNLPKLPTGVPDGRHLTSPEIYEYIERTFGIWKEISGQPEEHDKEKIAQWGRLFGRQCVLDTFEAARGKYRTLSEIYNSIGKVGGNGHDHGDTASASAGD